MSYKGYLLVLAAFIAGFMVNHYTRKSPPKQQDISILHISDPAAEPIRLQVHERPPSGQDIWRVDMDGRVLFAARDHK